MTSSVLFCLMELADAGNGAGQRPAQQFLDRNGMAALLMGNEELTIAFPLCRRQTPPGELDGRPAR